MLLAPGEDNKLCSRTLPPRSHRLPGRCASQASGAAPVSLLGSGSPLLRSEATVSPQGSWRLLEGRSPRAEGCRPGTSPAEAADVEGIPGEPCVTRRSPRLREGGPFLPPLPPPPGPAGAREPGEGRESVRPKGPGPEILKWGAKVVGGAGAPWFDAGRGGRVRGSPWWPPTFCPSIWPLGRDRHPPVLPGVCAVCPRPSCFLEPHSPQLPAGGGAGESGGAAAHRLGAG